MTIELKRSDILKYIASSFSYISKAKKEVAKRRGRKATWGEGISIDYKRGRVARASL